MQVGVTAKSAIEIDMEVGGGRSCELVMKMKYRLLRSKSLSGKIRFEAEIRFEGQVGVRGSKCES